MPKNSQLEEAYSYVYSVLVTIFLMPCESCPVMTMLRIALNLKSMRFNEYRKTTDTNKKGEPFYEQFYYHVMIWAFWSILQKSLISIILVVNILTSFLLDIFLFYISYIY